MCCLGKLVADYCPSISGCRSVVEFKDVADMQQIDVTDDQLRLAFNTSHAAVWLVHHRPYFLVISGLLCTVEAAWPGGVMVRVLAHDTKGLGFDSQPFHFQVTTLGKLFTHVCLCHHAV